VVLNVPAIALSQCYSFDTRQSPNFATAEKHAPDLVRRLLAETIPSGVLVNVNFPDCPPAKCAGFRDHARPARSRPLRIEPRHEARQSLLLDRVRAPPALRPTRLRHRRRRGQAHRGDAARLDMTTSRS
jgi:broad specificity polyphosphatase/5'/3'-nucleotidase SurE